MLCTYILPQRQCPPNCLRMHVHRLAIACVHLSIEISGLFVGYNCVCSIFSGISTQPTAVAFFGLTYVVGRPPV